MCFVISAFFESQTHISPWLIANPQLPSSASWQQGFSLRLIIDTLPKKLGWVWFMIFLHLFAKFTSQFAQFAQLPTLGSSAPTAGSCTLTNWANAPRTSRHLLFGMASFHEHHRWDESMGNWEAPPKKRMVQRTQIRDKTSEMHCATHKKIKCSPSVSWNSGLECHHFRLDKTGKLCHGSGKLDPCLRRDSAPSYIGKFSSHAPNYQKANRQSTACIYPSYPQNTVCYVLILGNWWWRILELFIDGVLFEKEDFPLLGVPVPTHFGRVAGNKGSQDSPMAPMSWARCFTHLYPADVFFKK